MKVLRSLCLSTKILVVFYLFSGCSSSDDKEKTPVVTTPIVVTPDSGRPGSAVTITGKNFGQYIRDSKVTFNGVEAIVSRLSILDDKDEIVAKVPLTATTGSVNIEVGGLLQKGPLFTIIGPHQITSISPTSGLVKTEVLIKGTFFSKVEGENQVFINDKRAEIISFSESELKITIPQGATSGKIQLSILGLKVEGPEFTVTDPTSALAISSFSPTNGFPYITEVVINGVFPNEKVSVKFNGKEAFVSFGSLTEIKVIVPGGSSTGKITVTSDGKSGVSTEYFDVKDAPQPVIVSFSPQEGLPHDIISVTGKNLAFSSTDNILKFNGIPGLVKTVETLSTGERVLTVEVPDGATTGLLTAIVNDKAVSSAQEFTIKQPPTITSFSPMSGTVGTLVTVSGDNFSSIAADNVVKIGDGVVPVIQAGKTQLIIKIPSSGIGAGGRISVNRQGEIATSTYSFIKFPSPLIIELLPGNGKTGDKIAIKGVGFGTTKKDVNVVFKGSNDSEINAAVVSVTESVIEVIVPPKSITGPIGVSVLLGDRNYSLSNFIIN